MRGELSLQPVFEEARGRGFLGPGPVMTHLDHASSFFAAAAPPERALDLGSGAGLPGLPLAVAWPESRWTLLEANGRKGRFLTWAVRELGLDDRVEVWVGRAEALGRETGRRGGFDLVVARGFGRPGVTAECGAPFLAPGGRLVVSEPPVPEPGRWPEQPLSLLGLRVVGVAPSKAAVMVLEQVRACPDRFPRRAPARRPLF